MDTLALNLADLLAAAPLASGASDCEAARGPLRPWQPRLVLVAESDGRLKAAFGDDSESTAAPLAARCAERLQDAPVCRFAAGGAGVGETVLAARLPGVSDGTIVACVLGSDAPAGTASDVLSDFGALVAALAARAAADAAERATLATRIEHFQAEHDTLRAAHSEATATALDEREERLHAQEEHARQLQAVMMMAADGIVTVNEEGVIKSFNEAAGLIFGYAPEEVVGRPLSMLMLIEFREYQYRHVVSFMEQSTPGTVSFASEVTGRSKDGTVFPLDIAVSEVSVDNQRLFTGIFRDITERKRAEQELRRLHLQNEMILNSVAEGICGVDHDGRATFINPAAARMLGYRPEEIAGARLHEKIHHSRADGTPNAWKQCPVYRALKDRLFARVDSEVFWRADGSPFPVEYTATPIDDGGKVAGAVITFRDISEQRMLEAQLRQAQKLESIGQLAAGIAHEINTPTQYIGDNTQFLGEAFDDIGNLLDRYARLLEAAKSGSIGEALIDEVQRAAAEADLDFVTREIPAAIRQSLDGVAQVARIVRSMKEFSHPGGDEKQAVDLNQAIGSTLTVSRNEWKYVADVVTDFDETLPHVTCLPSDFNQVMLNLVVNAAHAIGDRLGAEPGEKGTITVRTRRDGPMAEVRVADTGTGIPRAIRDRVFDPFFTTKEVGRGTGQGLAIVHSIITERHGGTIRLETELGRGTEFIVQLPIEPKGGQVAKNPVCR